MTLLVNIIFPYLQTYNRNRISEVELHCYYLLITLLLTGTCQRTYFLLSRGHKQDFPQGLSQCQVFTTQLSWTQEFTITTIIVISIEILG